MKEDETGSAGRGGGRSVIIVAETVANPPPEEPDALVAHVRVGERLGRQRPSLLGTRKTGSVCVLALLLVFRLAATPCGAETATNTPPANLPPATPALPFPPLDKLSIREKVDPFVCLDGTPVKSREDWVKKRQPELVKLLQHYWFGVPAAERLLEGTPPAEVVEVDKETLAAEGVVWMPVKLPLAPFKKKTPGQEPGAKEDPLVREGLEKPPTKTPPVQSEPEPVATLNVFYPAKGTGPFPTIFYMFGGKAPRHKQPLNPELKDQIAVTVGRGYALVIMGWNDGDEATVKYYFSEHSGPWVPPDLETGNVWRTRHGWSILARMGWRLRRAVEAVRKLPEVDPERIALLGGSRTGQPVLMAAGMDPRIKAVVCWQGICEWYPMKGFVPGGRPPVSGWPPILKEARDTNRLGAMPVGAWCLVAAIAPRPVLVCATTGGSGGSQETYYAVEQSLPVYRFLGAEVEMPADLSKLGNGLHGKGALRLHLASWGHSINLERDWKDWLVFLDEHLQPNTK